MRKPAAITLPLFSPVSTVDGLGGLVLAVRDYLETLWPEVRARNGLPADGPVSGDMCRLSSAFLVHVMETEIPGEGWRVRGGHRDFGPDTKPLAGGIRDPDGNWQSHYWVSDKRGNLLLDVTADQFGYPPVVVDPMLNVSSVYRENWRRWALDEHVRDTRWTVAAWMEGWKSVRAGHDADRTSTPTLR